MSLSIDFGFGDLLKSVGDLLAYANERGNALPQRALKYLDAVKLASTGLRGERENILGAAARVDLNDHAAVEQVRDRLRAYLYDYKLYPLIGDAIAGLKKCGGELGEGGVFFRKADKQAAAAEFNKVVDELAGLFTQLRFNFYPGGSGMGVQTLFPIYKMFEELANQLSSGFPLQAPERERWDTTRRDLLDAALRDNTHLQWIEHGARMEGLAEQLRQAFHLH